jgi:hypothetical protein
MQVIPVATGAAGGCCPCTRTTNKINGSIAARKPSFFMLSKYKQRAQHRFTPFGGFGCAVEKQDGSGKYYALELSSLNALNPVSTVLEGNNCNSLVPARRILSFVISAILG